MLGRQRLKYGAKDGVGRRPRAVYFGARREGDWRFEE